MIDSILLVPADGDPHGLLADGVCGARPPTLMWCYNTTTDVDRWARPGPGMRPHEGVRAARAIVLAHGGKPVPEGCDRLCRVIGDRPLFEYSIASVRLRADVYVQANRSARLVLLDADGRDVTP